MNGDDLGLNNGMTQTVTFETDDSVDEDVVDGMDAIDGVRAVRSTEYNLEVDFDPTVVDENVIRSAFENHGNAPLANGTMLGGRGSGLFGDLTEVTDDIMGRQTK
jgi:hypothetical protein